MKKMHLKYTDVKFKNSYNKLKISLIKKFKLIKLIIFHYHLKADDWFL